MLSVDLKVLRNGCLLVCRGDVLGAKEADYLFNLLTREDKGDVILDLAAVNSVGDEGLSVIALAYEMLMSVKRRLFLRNPSRELVTALRERHLDTIFETESLRLAPISKPH
jgi:anti-anti-sigma regulatory factor